MHNMLQKILQESKFIPNTKNLEDLLFARLQKRIQLKSRVAFVSYSLIGILSGISLSIYIKNLLIDFNNSGVYSYFHLIIGEDLNTLLLFSKEILYAFFESLPMMSLTVSLGLLFVVMISINGMITSLQRGHWTKKTLSLL